MLKYLCLLLFFSTFNLSLISQNIYCEEIETELKKLNTRFPFGVASGDPKAQSVVLWTCVYAFANDSNLIDVLYQVSEDPNFLSVVTESKVQTSKESGFTVKVNPDNLKDSKKYYYRFAVEGEYSSVGETYTANLKSDQLRFGVVSCSNYEWGYFNAYASLAKEKQLQAIIHLGDYIYEYKTGKFGDKKLPRKNLPAKEIISEQDYRSRYAQYRLDKDLQELHRLYPFITVWDDHEFANDAYQEGAQNHQEDEGSWEIRKAVASKVYFEWLPVAKSENFSVRRKFNFGEMVDLFMLDGRSEGRSKQVSGIADPSIKDSSRSMLGEKQANWLIKEVETSNAKWKIIGNQVIFSAFDYPSKLKAYSKSMDMWEGYPIERNRILKSWYNAGVKDIVVLTGDVHASFSMDLRNDIRDKNSSIGNEWVTTSVTSANLNEYSPTWKVRIVEKWFRRGEMNPHINHIDLRNHGYMLLEISNEEAKATWKYEKNITKPKPKIIKKVQRRIAHSGL